MKNQVKAFHRGRSTVHESQLHVCAQCGYPAAGRGNPLQEWSVMVNLGIRKDKWTRMTFFVHQFCMKVEVND